MSDTAITVLVLHPSGEVSDAVIEPSLPAMQRLVGGDIEVVTLLGDGTAMLFNADGKFANLEHNPTASRLLHMGGGRSDDWMAGTVAIIGPPENGDFTSTTPMGRAAVAEMRGDA